MFRIFSAIALFFITFLAHAQEAAIVPPPEDVNPAGLIVFAVLLVGSTAWFIWFIWSKEKQRKQNEAGTK